MNILIFGVTEIGYMVSQRLHQDHNVTVIEDLERPPEKYNNLDISFISGSAADVLALEQAALEQQELFIACSSLDEANIVACWTVKKIIDIESICFVHSQELYHNLASHNHYHSRHDIDTVIWPQQLLT